MEHKKTLVRAHVKNLSADPISASASLTAKDTVTGDILGTIPNSNVGGQIRILPAPDRANLDDSFLFEVPFAGRSGNVEFSFAGNESRFRVRGGGDDMQQSHCHFPTRSSPEHGVHVHDLQGRCRHRPYTNGGGCNPGNEDNFLGAIRSMFSTVSSKRPEVISMLVLVSPLSTRCL